MPWALPAAVLLLATQALLVTGYYVSLQDIPAAGRTFCGFSEIRVRQMERLKPTVVGSSAWG